jgi:hypothetical protein
MANEITYTNTMKYVKNSVTIYTGSADLNITVTGDHFVHRTQEIGHAAAEALHVGEIGTVGLAWFRNMDDTNYVEVGYDDSGFKNLIKLKAGESFGPVRLGQDAPYAQADTAAVDLEYILIED